MANFTDSRVIYFDEYAPKQYDRHGDTQSLDDSDYNESYLRQQSDSVWSLPNTPLLLTVDLAHIDNQDRKQISADLEIDEQDIEYLELYVERTDGDVQYLTINDNRYTNVEDIPEGLKNYLDTIYFGDVEQPVITVSGARVNLWDAIRGEPETQQAFHTAGFDSCDSQMELTGVFDSATTLDKLDDVRAVKLRDGLETQVVDAQVTRHLIKQNENRIAARKRKTYKTILAGVCVLLAVGIITALTLI